MASKIIIAFLLSLISVSAQPWIGMMNGYGQSSSGSAVPDVITFNTNNYVSSQISGATEYYGTNTSFFTYYGWPVTNVVNGSLNGREAFAPDMLSVPPLQTSFSFTGTNLEIVLSVYDFVAGGWSSEGYFTLQEGTNIVSATNCPDLHIGQDPYYANISFSKNTTHNLILSLKGCLYGINVPSGASISQHTLNHPNLLIVEGDSYVEGFDPVTVFHGLGLYWFTGYMWQLAKQMTNTIVIPSGIGGTGFVATDSGASTNYAGRIVNDILKLYTNCVATGLYSNVFITAAGTINDQIVNSNAYQNITSNSIYTQVTNVYTLLQSNCPGAHMFITGNWFGNSGNTTPASYDYVTEGAMTNAAAKVGLPIFDPVAALVLNPGNHSLVFPAGTDGVHPDAYGYGLYATWLHTNLTYVFGNLWGQ